jgi:hypothetical protein
VRDPDDLDMKLDDGTVVRFGYQNPDELKFAAAPAFDEANPLLAESEWEEHDDYARHTPEIEAQRNNNCTNAAIASNMQAVCSFSGVDCPRLSWSFLYAHANGGRDSGAMCRDVAQMLRDGPGLPPASVWPDSKIFLPRGDVAKVVLDAAAQYRALEIYQVFDFKGMMSALTQRFTVYFGVSLGRSFFRTRGDGNTPEWDGSLRNGHAMWARGTTKRFGDWRVIVPNSWGRSFGDNGVCYMPASYFWAERGNYVNLDAYAIRAVKRVDKLPQAAELPKAA